MQIVRRDRDTRGGGVAICLSNKIRYIPLEVHNRYGILEVCCVDVFMPGRHRIICVYRPPNIDLNYCTLLVEMLAELSNVTYPVTVGGDFNLPDIEWGSLRYPANELYRVFIDGILEAGLSQKVQQPTRALNTLDLLFTNSDLSLSNVTVQEPFSSSDHCTVEFSICGFSQPQICFSHYDFKNTNYASVKEFLVSFDWDLFLYVNTGSVNVMWDNFLAVVHEVVRCFVPLRKITADRGGHRYPRHIKKLACDKRFLWAHRYLPNGFDKYRECSARYSCAVKNFHVQKELNVLNSANRNKFFSYVNKKIAGSRGVGAIVYNDTVCLSDTDKCTAFSNYFRSVYVPDNNVVPYFNRRAGVGIGLDHVDFSPDVVNRQLSKLKPKFGHSPDGIPQGFLMKLHDVLAYPLYLIFKQSFNTSTVPDVWRTADVCPIYKKKDCSRPENYRPISLTSPCAKTMESIISKQMTDYLLRHKLLTRHQHGFLKGSSTCTQLLECTNEWCKSLDSGAAVEAVYVDFAKAFDTVCISKLLNKLEAYGFGSTLLAWHKAFLTGRSQRVKINNSFSGYFAVVSGVPQGSVLGPLYFMLFINDIVDVVPRGVGCKLFADDVKLYSIVKEFVNDGHLALQQGLNAISLWSKAWQLNISITKCYSIRYGPGQCSSFFLEGIELSRENGGTDLGVFFDGNLKVKSQCSLVAQKAFKVINMIFRCFHHYRADILLKAYCSYVRPILEYASVVWSPVYVSDIDTVEAVQRYFSRRLFAALHVEHRSYTERLQYCNLEPLELRRLYADLAMCYSIVHKDINLRFDEFFSFSPAIGITRGNTLKLSIATARRNVWSHSFASRVVPLWNSLPSIINGSPLIRARNVSIFKKRLRKVDFRNKLQFSRNL